jgi:hypothetical protein
MNRRLSVCILRLALGLVTGGYSLALVVSQIRGRTHYVLLVLGFAEVAAAVLFLIPRTVRLGGIALIVVFVAGAGVHVLHGQYNVAYLAVYTAAALAVIYEEPHA